MNHGCRFIVALSFLFLISSCQATSRSSPPAEESRYCELWDGSPLRANEKLKLVVNEWHTTSLSNGVERQTTPSARYIVVPIHWDIEDQPCTFEELG